MTSFVRQRAHPDYAEDQPYAHSILTFHVIRAGAALGSIISAATASLSALYFGPRNLNTLWTRLILHSSRGFVLGAVFGALAVTGRMWGREEIEWKDRSWRLLENQGQMETDNWLLAGAGIGVAAALARRPGALQNKMATVALGGAGLGMTSGTIGYLGYRYGLKGGKFPLFPEKRKEFRESSSKSSSS